MIKKLFLLFIGAQTVITYTADTSDIQEEFVRAVCSGNYLRANELLRSEKIDVNASMKYKDLDRPLLLVAANKFDVQMMDTLVNHGANVRAVDEEGNTVLHNLTEGRYGLPKDKDSEVASWMRFFIKQGADASVNNVHGSIALFNAADQSSGSACVEALMLDDLDEREEALECAITSKEPKNISKLLLCGVRINQNHEHMQWLISDVLSAEKKSKKIEKVNHLIKYATQSPYFIKHCFGWFKERLNDKRNAFQIVKGREIGKKR